MKKIPSILFIVVFLLAGRRASGQDFGDVSNNYWGGGSFSETGVSFSDNPPGDLTSLPSSTLGSSTTFTGITCLTSEYAGTKHKGVKALSNNTLPTGCQLSFNLGMGMSSDGEFASSYDTLKNFVQTCPTNVNAPGAFQIMSTDVQNGGNGSSPGCWTDFRNWLLSAFAWNPGNATYFCADVQVLAGALTNGIDTTYQQRNTGTNEGLSVIYWILHNPICNNSYDSELYRDSRGSQEQSWFDTQDTDSVKLDTTIYTMQQLGLDSVLKYAGLLGVSNANTPSIISNASANPNPTGEGTVISFGITREAYVSINLYDVLGHQVSTAGFGGVVEPGNLSVPMSLVDLPAGTYFARIQTTYGEVQSVKLVKE
jgi:hypothetical protein